MSVALPAGTSFGRSRVEVSTRQLRLARSRNSIDIADSLPQYLAPAAGLALLGFGGGTDDSIAMLTGAPRGGGRPAQAGAGPVEARTTSSAAVAMRCLGAVDPSSRSTSVPRAASTVRSTSWRTEVSRW